MSIKFSVFPVFEASPYDVCARKRLVVACAQLRQRLVGSIAVLTACPAAMRRRGSMTRTVVSPAVPDMGLPLLQAFARLAGMW